MRRFGWVWAAMLVVAACTGGLDVTTTPFSADTTTAPIVVSTTSMPMPSTPTSLVPASTSTTREVREFSSQVVGTFDVPPGAVRWVGVGVAPDGVPAVFHSVSEGWRLVFCEDWECSQQKIKAIDVGETQFLLPPSIQFGPDGLPVFTTPATARGMPMTIHACKDRVCTEADQTEFQTDQGGWVAVAESGRTLIGLNDGAMLRLFHAGSPGGDSLIEVSGHPYWTHSVKARGDGESFLILTSHPDVGGASGGRLSVLVVECDLECTQPIETEMGEVGIWMTPGAPDPMAAPRGGTSAFLAGSWPIENPQLVLVAWQSDPSQAVEIPLDEFPGQEGEIQGAAIAVGPTGCPVVVWNRVYYDRDLDDATELFVARCDTPDCTTGTIATLYQGVEEASAGGKVDVAVGPDDNPVLIYDNWNLTTEASEITLTRCVDPACTTTAISITTWSNQ